MPKAEVGSVKYLNKQMKMKGLQRLRFYCQVCEKQTRDENSFKQHTMSESHVRRMQAVGADPKKAINEFSDEFLRNFMQQLRTGHGEKAVQINHFYQGIIAQKDHVHINATKWSSLTEFAKHLAREGLCRVEETEKGIFVSWIDTSPEALKRQEVLRRKEAMDRGDEEWEQRMLKEQIARARRDAESRGAGEEGDEAEEGRGLQRQDGEKIKLSFGARPAAGGATPDVPASETKTSGPDEAPSADAGETGNGTPSIPLLKDPQDAAGRPAEAKPVSLKFGAKPQAKNVFAQARKNALAGGPKKTMAEPPKKMSEAERIMREELERKRVRESSGGFGGPNKRPRF